MARTQYTALFATLLVMMTAHTAADEFYEAEEADYLGTHRVGSTKIDTYRFDDGTTVTVPRGGGCCTKVYNNTGWSEIIVHEGGTISLSGSEPPPRHIIERQRSRAVEKANKDRERRERHERMENTADRNEPRD